MLVLGIESSCDETAAAVVRDGREILSSVISSQIEIHRAFGGVVPEVASREHLEKIEPVVEEALKKANVGFEDIDGFAVTQGPGLIGSLLVGVSYAKALAFALDKPIVGVNHIEGHVYSIAFENPPIRFPALALIVSGGHTNVFFMPEEGKYKRVAHTRDDAAGEAFDKVAKMLGLPYPGGPVIEKLALTGDSKKIKFTLPKISDGRPDFSFSGLKTAVSKYVRENAVAPVSNGGEPSQEIKDLAASFQAAVIRQLVGTLERLAVENEPQTLIVAGGVACNKALRTAVEKLGERLNIPVYFPSPHLSTDNAAMIAAAGTAHLKRGERDDLTLTADVTLRLQNIDVEDNRFKKGRKRYRF
jgi:N6-L-threonylcarbamoyladenine synthase